MKKSLIGIFAAAAMCLGTIASASEPAAHKLSGVVLGESVSSDVYETLVGYGYNVDIVNDGAILLANGDLFIEKVEFDRITVTFTGDKASLILAGQNTKNAKRAEREYARLVEGFYAKYPDASFFKEHNLFGEDEDSWARLSMDETGRITYTLCCK